METLYEKIEGLCKERGVSIAKMCRGAKIPPSIIYELKSGKHDGLSIKSSKKIAEYFGVSISDLYQPIAIDTGAISQAVLTAFQEKKEPPGTDGKEQDGRFDFMLDLTPEELKSVEAFVAGVKSQRKQ